VKGWEKSTFIKFMPCLVIFCSVSDLPAGVENLILAVPSELSEEIAEQAAGSGIKRIWMVNGMGKGAYSEKAHHTCTENQISPN
jgi:predicted CoA-binding protein